MPNLFEQNRNYVLGDQELDLIALETAKSSHNGDTRTLVQRSISWDAKLFIAALILTRGQKRNALILMAVQTNGQACLNARNQKGPPLYL